MERRPPARHSGLYPGGRAKGLGTLAAALASQCSCTGTPDAGVCGRDVKRYALRALRPDQPPLDCRRFLLSTAATQGSVAVRARTRRDALHPLAWAPARRRLVARHVQLGRVECGLHHVPHASPGGVIACTGLRHIAQSSCRACTRGRVLIDGCILIYIYYARLPILYAVYTGHYLFKIWL